MPALDYGRIALRHWPISALLRVVQVYSRKPDTNPNPIPGPQSTEFCSPSAQVRWEPIGHEDIAQAQKGDANSAALDYLQARFWSPAL